MISCPMCGGNYCGCYINTKKVFILKGRQLSKTTIGKRFKMFWDIRKPCWKGTDADLIDNIFDDPDFKKGLIL